MQAGGNEKFLVRISNEFVRHGARDEVMHPLRFVYFILLLLTDGRWLNDGHGHFLLCGRAAHL